VNINGRAIDQKELWQTVFLCRLGPTWKLRILYLRVSERWVISTNTMKLTLSFAALFTLLTLTHAERSCQLVRTHIGADKEVEVDSYVCDDAGIQRRQTNETNVCGAACA
jgi:hypothetical protein